MYHISFPTKPEGFRIDRTETSAPNRPRGTVLFGAVDQVLQGKGFWISIQLQHLKIRTAMGLSFERETMKTYKGVGLDIATSMLQVLDM